VELIAVFSVLTALGPPSFPRLKAAVPALLSAGGAMVEWAQHFRLAPGVGSLSDLTAEIAGIVAASCVMLLAAAARLSPRNRHPRRFS
jgi:hypothetical protein